jgi:hypothetical protein
MARRGRTPLLGLLAVAGLCTLLNAAKPLHLDDAAYSAYAHHIARQPLDPYGFPIFWYDHPQPAAEVLAPPVLPYWWAAGIRLFGERPVLWKMWLLPFLLLLTWALYALFRRFCRGLEWPLTWLTVLSPAVLPGVNLMLDVPALALGLAAVAVFLRAGDRDSMALAVLAGLLAGLAAQTKYTGLLAPAVLLLNGVLRRRLRLAALAGAVAALVFAGWEGFLVWKYGQSHFLYHLAARPGSSDPKQALLQSMLANLGGVLPAAVLLALAALRARRGTVLAAGVLAALGYVLLAVVPERDGILLGDAATHADRLSLRHVVCGLSGIAIVLTVAAVAWRLGRPGRRSTRRHAARFLLLWLALEVGGSVLLTPFPAVRRVLGVAVVVTLLAGRLASRTCRAPARRRLVWGVTAASIALGLVFYAADFQSARAQQELAEGAAAWVRHQGTGGTAWYVGHWSFQYYAERRGLRPVDPGRSVLHRGDYLVVPDERVTQQPVTLSTDRMELAADLTARALLPLRTLPAYYGGRTPLEHHEGPLLTVRVYRITAEEWVPPVPPVSTLSVSRTTHP